MDFQDDVNDANFVPQTENLGTSHPIDFSQVIQFAMRFNLSNFVTSGMINLTGKAYGVDDPNLLTTPFLVRDLKKKVGRLAVEEHSKKIKGLVCIKVVTFVLF